MSDGYFALDDFLILETDVCDTRPPSAAVGGGSSEYECDFESEDACGFTAYTEGEQFDFVRVTGLQAEEHGMQFPTTDRHGSGEGHYFGVERVRTDNTDTVYKVAYLESPLFDRTYDICLRFWYSIAVSKQRRK